MVGNNNNTNSKVTEALSSLSAADLLGDPVGQQILASMSGNTAQQQAAAQLHVNAEQRLAMAAMSGIQPDSLESSTLERVNRDSERRVRRNNILERVFWVSVILLLNFDITGKYNDWVKPVFDASGKRTLVKVKQIVDSASLGLEQVTARMDQIDQELEEIEDGILKSELRAEKGSLLIAFNGLKQNLAHYKPIHEADMSLTNANINVDSIVAWSKNNPGKIYGEV